MEIYHKYIEFSHRKYIGFSHLCETSYFGGFGICLATGEKISISINVRPSLAEDTVTECFMGHSLRLNFLPQYTMLVGDGGKARQYVLPHFS